jgi:hypothetical protein
MYEFLTPPKSIPHSAELIDALLIHFHLAAVVDFSAMMNNDEAEDSLGILSMDGDVKRVNFSTSSDMLSFNLQDGQPSPSALFASSRLPIGSLSGTKSRPMFSRTHVTPASDSRRISTHVDVSDIADSPFKSPPRSGAPPIESGSTAIADQSSIIVHCEHQSHRPLNMVHTFVEFIAPTSLGARLCIFHATLVVSLGVFDSVSPCAPSLLQISPALSLEPDSSMGT